MGKIKQMAESLANQIAAGEVVERPASVVKELVENAIDAQSSEIIIELIEAGIQSIRVTDNGEGMDKDDLFLAVLAHATSKIYHRDDLFKIQSLGFRGEALASIASVSKVRIESNTVNQQTGHYLEMEGSIIKDQGLAPIKQGTSITVNSLFYNTPARLKHLKTIQTELSHSVKYIQNIALAYPQIRFTLRHNQGLVFSSNGNSDLQQAIANVYQPSIARQLISIKGQNHDFMIHGYISNPTLTRTSKRYLHWFINGRPIRSFWLDEVLIKAYNRQLMIGRYPISVIHINLDPRLVDVNVHPTKQTVRLSKEDELSVLLIESIQNSLKEINSVPSLEQTDSKIWQDVSKENNVDNIESEWETSHNFHSKEINSSHDDYIHEVSNVNYPKDKFNLSTESIKQETLINFNHLRYVGQIHGTYLIAQDEFSFYLIDQHAAQERIRYEEFMREEYPIHTQQTLLIAKTFNFTKAEMSEIEELMPTFNNLGIYLESFGPNSYKLDSYPNWMDQNEVDSLVTDLTDLLIKNPHLSIQEIKEASIIMRSCRGAIKANHYLDDQQAEALINDLEGLDDPFHCPHGRPVLVEFDQKTLEKLFKRIQDSHEGGIVR